MARDTDHLIAGLVESLEPAAPLRIARGAVLAVGGLVLAIGVLTLTFGVRADLGSGHPHAMFILGGGLFLLLGVACTTATLAMSSPRVGAGRNGWGWSAATVGLLPLAALAAAFVRGRSAWAASVPSHGVFCLTLSLGMALIYAAILVFWLRRGAPASPERAGLLTGIAAGCAGVVAVTFVCPIDTVMHIGLWHGLAVTISALAGRLIVPHLVRW